jgi:hypothetical protein
MKIAKLLLWTGIILGSINSFLMILSYSKEKAPFIGMQLGSVFIGILFLILVYYGEKKEK